MSKQKRGQTVCLHFFWTVIAISENCPGLAQAWMKCNPSIESMYKEAFCGGSTKKVPPAQTMMGSNGKDCLEMKQIPATKDTCVNTSMSVWVVRRLKKVSNVVLFGTKHTLCMNLVHLDCGESPVQWRPLSKSISVLSICCCGLGVELWQCGLNREHTLAQIPDRTILKSRSHHSKQSFQPQQIFF